MRQELFNNGKMIIKIVQNEDGIYQAHRSHDGGTGFHSLELRPLIPVPENLVKKISEAGGTPEKNLYIKNYDAWREPTLWGCVPAAIRDEWMKYYEMNQSKISEKKSKIESIEGLEILREAISDMNRWHDEFNCRMDNEYESSISPKAPKYNENEIKELKTQYPIADLYLRAENYSCAAHDQKAAAGKDAMRMIENGQIEEASRRMENWLPESAIWS